MGLGFRVIKKSKFSGILCGVRRGDVAGPVKNGEPILAWNSREVLRANLNKPVKTLCWKKPWSSPVNLLLLATAEARFLGSPAKIANLYATLATARYREPASPAFLLFAADRIGRDHLAGVISRWCLRLHCVIQAHVRSLGRFEELAAAVLHGFSFATGTANHWRTALCGGLQLCL